MGQQSAKTFQGNVHHAQHRFRLCQDHKAHATNWFQKSSCTQRQGTRSSHDAKQEILRRNRPWCLPRTERCLSSVLSNCVSVSLMPTLGSGARKTNKYRDFSVCQIWCLLCFYQYFRKLIAFLENFFFALII